MTKEENKAFEFGVEEYGDTISIVNKLAKRYDRNYVVADIDHMGIIKWYVPKKSIPDNFIVCTREIAESCRDKFLTLWRYKSIESKYYELVNMATQEDFQKYFCSGYSLNHLVSLLESKHITYAKTEICEYESSQ